MNEKSDSIYTALNRRTFAARAAALIPAIGIVATPFGTPRAQAASSNPPGDVSHNAETIHQENVFKAVPSRVYAALTDSDQFTEVTSLITDFHAGAAQISREVGGAFACFGGLIIGRHIELIPNERIVQAWRVASWDEGVYSIARFQLKPEGPGTRIIFDHTGFPIGDGAHLASGWNAHYWQPLAKYFSP